MTTTVFYHNFIHDKEKQDVKTELEFGGTSYYGGENLMYLRIDGKFMVLDRETGVKFSMPSRSSELISALMNLKPPSPCELSF